MGRKNRNKSEKTEKVIEEEEETDEEERDNEFFQQIKETEFNDIWQLKNSMIKYCERISIPLCSYLTIETLENFIKVNRKTLET